MMMVELFFLFPIDTMDLQQQQTDLQDNILKKDGQERAKERHEMKSTFNISFQIHFCLFCLGRKHFSLFLEFYWLLPSICLLHDAAFCRRVG